MDKLPEWAVDAADIPDTARVLRRVPPQQIESSIPTSANFRERDDDPLTGLSVTYWHSHSDEQDVLRFQPDFGLISIVVAQVRSCGLILVRVPLVGNLNHCEIMGKVTKGIAKRLKASSRWVRPPPSLDSALFEPLDVHHVEVAPQVSDVRCP